MMNNDSISSPWMMKTAYTSQSSLVAKFLREGFEPFWGYRCTHKDKPDVKMYFRKAPEPVVTELEMLESEPPVVQFDTGIIDSIVNRVAGMLNDAVMDLSKELHTSIEIKPPFPIRAGGTANVVRNDEEENDGLLPDGMPDLTAEEVAADVAEAASYDESHPPAGDNFRVIDEAPDLPVQARTQLQDDVIESIRNSADVNITVYPIDENGVVRVFAGDKVTHIYPDGRTKQEKNTAKTSSLAEGV